MENYLLAVIREGDGWDPHLERFFRSLPMTTKKIFESQGRVKNQSNPNDDGLRHFYILHSPKFENLFTTYFLKREGAKLKQIPDKLRIKTIIKNSNTSRFCSDIGTINETIQEYSKYEKKDPKEIFVHYLNKNQDLIKFTKKRCLGLKKGRIIKPSKLILQLEAFYPETYEEYILKNKEYNSLSSIINI